MEMYGFSAAPPKRTVNCKCAVCATECHRSPLNMVTICSKQCLDNHWSIRQILPDTNPVVVSIYTGVSYLTHGDRLWFLDAIIASGASSVIVGVAGMSSWIQASLNYTIPLRPFSPFDVFSKTMIVIGTSDNYCANTEYFRDVEHRQPLYQWLDRPNIVNP